MQRIFWGLALAAALTAPAAADWQRHGQATGPKGQTVQSDGKGSCTGGRCEWTRQTDGPRGNSATTTGSAARTGSGEWSGQSTTTGSGGRQVKREGSLHVTR